MSNQEEEEQSRWFAEEVQPHESGLRSFLKRASPARSDEDDLVQETYMRLLRAREKGEIRSAKALMFTIARNALRDFLRRKGKNPNIPVTETDEIAVLDDGVGVVESVCRQQELALLAEAINHLPERCREVLLLRKIKGHSQREIADLLGITENTVESLTTKGVRRCSKYLRTRKVTRRNQDVTRI